MTIPEPDVILEKLTNIHDRCKKNKDISEEKLKRYFHRSGILEVLRYDEEDIHVEKTVKAQKRTDIHVTDDYGNVVAVIEFKKPSVKNLRDHFDQLWKRYMIPLKAKYGFLYNGFELHFFKRIRDNYDKKFGMNVLDLESSDGAEIVKHIQKPDYDLTNIDVVTEYLEGFKEKEEKLNLKEEASREHFFENFKLEKDSGFGDLLKATINLFNEMEKKEGYDFLKSAYDFWKMSYAKKPDKVPKKWKPIMKECGLGKGKKDLYKFMFCLETTYALFTRLILAKSAEDYGFSDIRFVGFLENEIQRASWRKEIPRASWAKMTQKLIENMKNKLVSSVFEEDIFYWWTEPYENQSYEELYKYSIVDDLIIAADDFGEKIRKILLTFCKFDFSEIRGDPLGILYQRYFDKETRKALGEFYTPQEVVDYILDAVDYKGRKVLDKRLLDPACGSGTFLVTALKRYLNASEDVAEDRGWNWVLDNLCNNYRIVGFDIH
ncbi:MAG: type I restriction enzyme HsdR N-terminal domain-containing protein, partial [Thermoplasmata archaeon]